MDKKYAQFLLGKVNDDYNLISEEFSRSRRNIWPEIRFLFDNYLKKGENILDLGCGNGRFYNIFQEKKVKYIGIDKSQQLVRLAMKKYPLADFREGDAFNLPFPDNYFDKIFSIAVLHHIPSEELRLKFLKEAKRVLKKDGLLILTVWHFSGWDNYFLLLKYTILKLMGRSKLGFKDILKRWGKKAKRYYHWFSEKELRNLVKKVNLEIKEIGIVKNKDKQRQNIYLVAKNNKV